MAKKTSYGVAPYRFRNGVIEILIGRPKGHVEFGFLKGKSEKRESALDTARREFNEETNGGVIKKSKMVTMFFQRNKRKDVGIFLVKESAIKNG